MDSRKKGRMVCDGTKRVWYMYVFVCLREHSFIV